MATATTIVDSTWVPPDPIVGFSGTAVEENSFVQLNWTISTEGVDFEDYHIYRRVQGGDGIWVLLVMIDTQAVVEYIDYSVGQTIVYEYIITQLKSVTGDASLESDPSETVTASLVTDAWFILANINGDYSVSEINVTDETHTNVIQQETFEPLASDRKRVVRGNVLGNEGTVTSIFDTSVARDAKVYFDVLSATAGPHILKSPFGDVWYVEYDAPGFKYKAGGHLEVAIGWVAVA